MHVLIIPSWYPEFKGDNFGGFFREQAISLKKSGVDVGIIYPNIKSVKKFTPLKHKTYDTFFYEDNGVNVFQCNSYNWMPKNQKVSTHLWAFFGMLLFEKYKKKYGLPDVIHVQSMLNGCLLARNIKAKFNIPFIVTEHSSDFIRGRHADRITKWALSLTKKASYRLAVSNSQVEYLTSKSIDLTWDFLPNIVNQKFLDSTVKKNERYNFIHVASLNRNKGTALLIDAFASSFKDKPDVTLTVCGDGPEMPNIQKQIEDYGIESQVYLRGHLSRELVLQEMCMSSSLVVSSYYETFSIVCIEALAVGIPVVATKCGGPESIITAENGLIVEKGCRIALAKGMVNIFEQRQRYDPKKLKEDCNKRFGEVAVIERLKVIMKQSIDENKASKIDKL